MDQAALYDSILQIASFMHAARAKALARVVLAIVGMQVARTWALAEFIARRSGISFKSGLLAVSRLLGNHRVDWWRLGAELLKSVTPADGTPVPLAVDWTEWHGDKRALVAAAVLGKRAIPIAAEGFNKQDMPRSQNARENTFLQLLMQLVADACRRVVIMTDRGFRRVSWVLKLQETSLDFAVRLMDDVFVRRKRWSEPRALCSLHLQPGQVIDLGVVELRKDGAATVRIIGMWALGQKEPWWIATSLSVPAAEVASWYDRRMGVEEQLRDSKGCRYGVEMFWTMFDDPSRIGHLFVLVGIALAVWTATGVEVAGRDKTARFPHPTKGPRRSYATIGRQAAAALYSMTGCVVVSAGWLLAKIPRPELRKLGRGLRRVPPDVAGAGPGGDQS